MNTNPDPSPRHRHLVALPLLLLTMLVAAGSTHVLQASVSSVKNEKYRAASVSIDQSFPSGLRVHVEPKSEALVDVIGKEVNVLDGTAIIAANSYARIKSDQVIVSLINGSVAVLREADQVTIVALSGPILAEQTENIHILMTGDQLIFKDASGTSITKRSEAEQDWRERMIKLLPTDEHTIISDSGIMNAIEASKYVEAEALISVTDLTDEYHLSVLPILLSQEVRNTDHHALIRSILKKLGAGDSVLTLTTLRLLSDGHLAADDSQLDALRTLRVADVSSLERLLLQMIDESKGPVSALLIAVWEDRARQAIVEDPSGATSIIEKAEELMQSFDERGYPLTANALQSSLEHVRKFSLGLVTDAEKINSPTSSAGTQADQVLTDHQKVALTQAKLTDAGALFLVNTELTVKDALVAVENIIFAHTPDDFYSFDIDPVSGIVSGIEKNGVRYPNSISLNGLMESLND